MALSALLSCMTPTVALAIKIKRMTAGSTKTDQNEEPSESSKRARTKETTAEASRMRTSWSLNCSKISSQRGVGSSSGSSVCERRGGVRTAMTGEGRTNR